MRRLHSKSNVPSKLAGIVPFQEKIQMCEIANLTFRCLIRIHVSILLKIDDQLGFLWKNDYLYSQTRSHN